MGILAGRKDERVVPGGTPCMPANLAEVPEMGVSVLPAGTDRDSGLARRARTT